MPKNAKDIIVTAYTTLYFIELALAVYAFKKRVPLDWSYGSFLYQNTLSSIVLTRTIGILMTLSLLREEGTSKYDYMELSYSCLLLVSCIYVGISIVKSRRSDKALEIDPK